MTKSINLSLTKKLQNKKSDGTLFPIHRKPLLSATDLEIVMAYNAELRGICNYYGIASNYYKLCYLAYLMEYSCLKTLANKHKCKISRVIKMFKDGNGKWGIPYETSKGLKRCYFVDYSKCKSNKNPTDNICNAAVKYRYSRSSIEERLKANICELCGTTESEYYEIHHINKLKNLKGKELWEIMMIAKHRKTMVVCRDCHHAIHKQ